MLNLPDTIGLIAGILTSASFIPQIYKTYKTKKAKDISYLMLLVLLAGMILWLTYGILIQSKPVIIANAISISANGALIAMKIKYS